ncbi:MAG: polyprenyl synthetase family protein [Actinomycetota bacterium]|nr:polyprenyl synthetase family protein [Actinomycetota bacterium]
MTSPSTAATPWPLDVEDLRARVQQALDDFLAHQAKALAELGVDLVPVMDAAAELLRGGKRLRAAFCYWAWRGAGGPSCPEAVAAAASLELFQAAALVHDDVMDGSDTRRGLPSAHRRFEALHRDAAYVGSAGTYGVAGAILLGDLYLCWSDEMLASSGLSAQQLGRGRPVFDLMRTQLIGGQFLDILSQARADTTVDTARTVIRYKTAKYTAEHPLLLGGSLAGAPAELLHTYSRYGLLVGEAYQLRDDVLGVFGEPVETGKPAGDDLREGKRTVLVATALERASKAQASAVRRHLGNPDLDERGVAALRAVLTETGAVQAVEHRIAALTDEAVQVIDGADGAEQPARTVLRDLAVAAGARRA